MATKKVTGGYKVVKKDGTLGKTVFKTQKAAQVRSRGPGKKGAKRRAVAKRPAATATAHKIGTGRSYQGVRLTMLVLSPATDKALAVQAGATTVSGALTALKDDLISRPHASHLAVVAADVIIDRNPKVGQAAAMSRGSVTAWAPEVYIFAKGVDDWRGGASVRDINRNAVARQTGYDPALRTWTPARARTYRTIKHGGQVLRISANRIGLLKSLKRALSEMILKPVGATL